MENNWLNTFIGILATIVTLNGILFKYQNNHIRDSVKSSEEFKESTGESLLQIQKDIRDLYEMTHNNKLEVERDFVRKNYFAESEKRVMATLFSIKDDIATLIKDSSHKGS